MKKGLRPHLECCGELRRDIRRTALMKKGLRLHELLHRRLRLHSENSPDEEGIKTFSLDFLEAELVIRRTALMKKGLRPSTCEIERGIAGFGEQP